MASKEAAESTLLIVTDRPVDGQALKALLAPQGYQVYLASNRAQALADGPAVHPDVVLIDAEMSDGAGLEICRSLKSDPQAASIPILMYTSERDGNSLHACFKSGAADLLARPFQPLEVLARVRNLALLSRYRRPQDEDQVALASPSQADTPPTDPNLKLLQRVLSNLLTQLDPYEILYSTCEVISQVFTASEVAAWVASEDASHYEQVARYPLYPRSQADEQATRPSYSVVRASLLGEVLPMDQNPWIKQLASARAVMQIDDRNFRALASPAEAQPAPGRTLGPIRRARKGRTNGHTRTVIPLLTRGNLTGFIEFTHQEPRTLSQTDLDLANNMARTVGESLEAIRIFQRLQSYADFLDKSLAQRTEELEGERDRTQSILEALGEAVVVTDLEGRIQYVNQAAVELTGYSRQALLGQRMRLWRSHRQTAELYTQMLSSVQQGQTWRGEVINERQDGTLYDAALTVAPLYGGDESRQPIGYVSVQRDITPIKEAERIKDQFVSNVSHELRTPLSIITLLIGNLDTLYERLDDEKRRKLIRDVRGHVQVLNDLINNVLEISRLEGGRVSRERQAINLADIVRQEAEKQLPLANNKYQTLMVECPEALMVDGNEGQLRQVFRNLVNNAIKYTPEGGYVVCEGKAGVGPADDPGEWPACDELGDGPWVAVRVKDTGIGIQPDDQQRLFDRFYRVETQGNVPGAGLGLSIANDLVKMHGGRITLASTPLEGSVFAVYLPPQERE